MTISRSAMMRSSLGVRSARKSHLSGSGRPRTGAPGGQRFPFCSLTLDLQDTKSHLAHSTPSITLDVFSNTKQKNPRSYPKRICTKSATGRRQNSRDRASLKEEGKEAPARPRGMARRRSWREWCFGGRGAGGDICRLQPRCSPTGERLIRGHLIAPH